MSDVRIDLRRKKAVGKIVILLLLIGIFAVVSGAVITTSRLVTQNSSSIQANSVSTNSHTRTSNNSYSSSSFPQTSTTQMTNTSETSLASSSSPSSITIGVSNGELAPDFPITYLNGSATELYTFHGRPVLLWFVTTYCSSCQQGAELLSQQYYQEFYGKGVTIITIELYNNLGQTGPNLSQFANQYGDGLNKSNWYYGYSNQTTTYTFDPKAALDAYYALNAKGVIVEEGIGLPNALQSLSTDATWYS